MLATVKPAVTISSFSRKAHRRIRHAPQCSPTAGCSSTKAHKFNSPEEWLQQPGPEPHFNILQDSITCVREGSGWVKSRETVSQYSSVLFVFFRATKYRNLRVRMSVCLSVCLSVRWHISETESTVLWAFHTIQPSSWLMHTC